MGFEGIGYVYLRKCTQVTMNFIMHKLSHDFDNCFITYKLDKDSATQCIVESLVNVEFLGGS